MIQILVVEGDAVHCRLLDLILKLDGYRTISVSTGKEAFATFASHPIDLVMLDVHLPDISGYTVCTELRKVSTVPILLVSALTRTKDIMLGFQAGANDYLPKPFDIQSMRSVIRGLLQSARLHSDLPGMNFNGYHQRAEVSIQTST